MSETKLPKVPGRILFLDTFTDPTFKSISSSEIGFGISCADAIKKGLRKLDLEITECSLAIQDNSIKLDWIYNCYQNLSQLNPTQNDIVFIFHSLIHFPGEIRRLINHHTRKGCSIIAYAHGSHWDKTDTVRNFSSPRLLFQDLANLLTCDYLLVVSDYYRKLLRNELSALGPLITDRFDKIVRVVGVPIDTESIDNFKLLKNPQRDVVQILFNHSLRPPKRPEIALLVIEKALEKFDNCIVNITRSFEKATPLGMELKRLSNKFKDRVICHDNLILNNYYKLLWECDIQFSTASHESLGIATIEAMYTGNACFTPDDLSYPEITGGIGNYDSFEKLGSLIDKAISSYEFRTTISNIQKKQALKYAPDKISDKLNSIIEEAFVANLSIASPS